MKHKRNSHQGFTLLELLTVVAIVGILGALAVVGYQQYVTRARAADILEKYDGIKTRFQVAAATLNFDDCAELAKKLDASNLADPYTTLAYGFEASGGGYRPVLTVCAKADAQNKIGVKVARGAYDTMAKTGVVEKGAVLTDTLVSFALPLTAGSAPMCKVAVATTTAACGAAAPPNLPPSTPVPNCPAGSEPVQAEDAAGKPVVACMDKCPAGQTRDPKTLKCVASAAQVFQIQPHTTGVTPRTCAAGMVQNPVNAGQCVPAPTKTGSGALACAAGQEVLSVNGASLCAWQCVAGQTRDPANPISCKSPPPPAALAAVLAKLPPLPPVEEQFAALGCTATQEIISDGSGEKCADRCPADQYRDPDNMATCVAKGTTPASAQTAKDPCNNAYDNDNQNCVDDFPGVCDVSYVQEVCRLTCGVCTPGGGSIPTVRKGTNDQGISDQAPQVPWLYFSIPAPKVLPTDPWVPVTITAAELLKMLGATNPDGSPLSTMQVLDIRMGAPEFVATRTPSGDWTFSRRWIYARTGGAMATITIANAQGTNRLVTRLDFQ